MRLVQVTDGKIRERHLRNVIERFGGDPRRAKYEAAKWIANTIALEVLVEKKARKDLTIDPRDIDFHDLAKVFMAAEAWAAVANNRGDDYSRALHMESGDPIRLGDFFGPLGGQIIFSEIALSMQEEDDISAQLVTERASRFRFERIPWFQEFKDEQPNTRESGEAFKEIGFGREFIETPLTEEFGRLITVEERDIFFERLSQNGGMGVMDKARQVGKVIAWEKQDKILKGGPLGLVNYNWSRALPGAGLAPYVTGAPTPPADWTNQLPGNPLVDKNSLQVLQDLLDAMVDPVSGRAVETDGVNLLTSKANRYNAQHIVNAIETREVRPSGIETLTRGNGLNVTPSLHHSQQVARLAASTGVSTSLANAAGMYWYGNFKEAWGWLSNWGMQVVSYGGTNTEQYVSRGVILKVRAGMMGGFHWRANGPRKVTRSYNVL